MLYFVAKASHAVTCLCHLGSSAARPVLPKPPAGGGGGAGGAGGGWGGGCGISGGGRGGGGVEECRLLVKPVLPRSCS